MQKLSVEHTTAYRYANPVELGPHRLMVRPRDSHDLRLVSATLTLSPPADLRWVYDVFGNSIAIATFSTPTTELRVESVLEIERYARQTAPAELDADAASYPFVYAAEDRTDLGRMLERHYPDPKSVVDDWVKGFVAARPTDTLALLADINNGIKNGFLYQARESEGTQSPIETLERGSGTCRDFALLMIEAVRSLGFGARFVTGYLYDPSLDGGEAGGILGAAATHAWAEIYLPGAGWIDYDPTNALIGSENLIRVAVCRDPSQALPVSGSFVGGTLDFLGMTVNVHIARSREDERQPEPAPLPG